MSHMRTCQRCRTPYDWRRSLSGLKMTYCSVLCEAGGLGFTIEAALHMVRDDAWLVELLKLGLNPDDVE